MSRSFCRNPLLAADQLTWPLTSRGLQVGINYHLRFLIPVPFVLKSSSGLDGRNLWVHGFRGQALSDSFANSSFNNGGPCRCHVIRI
jgi:hypothetical protein